MELPGQLARGGGGSAFTPRSRSVLTGTAHEHMGGARCLRCQGLNSPSMKSTRAPDREGAVQNAIPTKVILPSLFIVHLSPCRPHGRSGTS